MEVEKKGVGEEEGVEEEEGGRVFQPAKTP